MYVVITLYLNLSGMGWDDACVYIGFRLGFCLRL